MDRLHRGDDAALAEAREIGGVDDLRVLDPPAAIALVGVRHRLDRIERLGVGLVADRVDRDLEAVHRRAAHQVLERSEEHTSELQSLMRISYAVFCLKKKK